MQDISIGIIGLGGICRDRHLPGFKKIPGVSIRAVANRTRASAERAAQEYGIPVVCDTWRKIIDRDDINTVLIGTWPNLHCEASTAALQAGKHVFCQARMARNRHEAEYMHEAACASGKVAALCPVPIGLNIDRVLARLLREATIGAIRSVCVRSVNNAWCNADAPMTWRKDHRISGLNMQTLGMYIEVMHRWFGETSTVSAHKFTYTSHRQDLDGVLTEVQIPDQITINSVVGEALPVQYLISGVSGMVEDSIDILGDKGALHYDVNEDRLYLNTGRGNEIVEIPPDEYYDIDHWTVEQDFVNAIREGMPCHPDFTDGLRYMRVIQAVYDSAEKHCHVNVEKIT